MKQLILSNVPRVLNLPKVRFSKYPVASKFVQPGIGSSLNRPKLFIRAAPTPTKTIANILEIAGSGTSGEAKSQERQLKKSWSEFVDKDKEQKEAQLSKDTKAFEEAKSFVNNLKSKRQTPTKKVSLKSAKKPKFSVSK